MLHQTKRGLGLLAAVCALLCCMCLLVQADDTIAATGTKSNGSPYYIMVNRQMNTVTVYALDDNGYYSVPYKAMICSCGRSGHATPLGTYAINSQRRTWCLMFDGTYGQYSSAFNGNILFHSVCYSAKSKTSLIYSEYNTLGSVASLGCVRLQVADAKWIYDNCPVGTKVTVYESENPGALGKPNRKVDVITAETNNGWEPTDPDENNPWHYVNVTGIALDQSSLNMEVGEVQTLIATVSPADATEPAVTWTSSNPAAATVDSEGKVAAVNGGTATITAFCSGIVATCQVNVTGTALPFVDILPGSWYYKNVRYVYTNSVFVGTSDTTYSPNAAMNRAMLVQVLYNMEGKPEVQTAVNPFTDVTAEDWYYRAVLWAYEKEIVTGITETTFAPLDVLTREQFATLLYRYYTVYLAQEPDYFASINTYTDVGQVSHYAIPAIKWAVGNGIIDSTSTEELVLSPVGAATRAQAAAILERYCVAFPKG